MKDIAELVKNTKKYKKAVIQKTFKSKKNTVAYVTLNKKPRVLKWFVPGLKRQMKTEYSILKKGSKKLNIPAVYEIDDKNNVITTQYIIGENLCDIINDKNTSINEKQRLIILLVDWYIKFHNYFKNKNQFIIRGDSTLRNFIFTDKIWGVDFEESRTGQPVEDIAGICSSILTTTPMFTKEKFKLCKLFIDTYIQQAPGRILNVNEEIAYAILEKIQWRQDEEETLRKYCNKIRINGL